MKLENYQHLMFFAEADKFFTHGLATTTLEDSKNRMLSKENIEQAYQTLQNYTYVYHGHEDRPVADLLFKAIDRKGKSYRTEVVNIAKFLTEFPSFADVLPEGDYSEEWGLHVVCSVRNDTEASKRVRKMIKTGELNAHSIHGELIDWAEYCDADTGHCMILGKEFECYSVIFTNNPANPAAKMQYLAEKNHGDTMDKKEEEESKPEFTSACPPGWWEECLEKNKDAKDPNAYCAKIARQRGFIADEDCGCEEKEGDKKMKTEKEEPPKEEEVKEQEEEEAMTVEERITRLEEMIQEILKRLAAESTETETETETEKEETKETESKTVEGELLESQELTEEKVKQIITDTIKQFTSSVGGEFQGKSEEVKSTGNLRMEDVMKMTTLELESKFKGE